MKQFSQLTMLLAALATGACTSDSSLPTPTGEASVRAINAIPRSPGVGFLIEERSLGTIDYQSASAVTSYDDFTYTFNFEVRFAGDLQNTRFASETVDFVPDTEYTLVLTGSIASPTVTVWETPEREFSEGESIFQTRFAHTAASLAGQTVDVYFELDGVAPVAGQQVATLDFGEISPPMDYAPGSYVVTLTTAGDVNDVLYESTATAVSSQANIIISPFDGTANNVAPIVLRGIAVSAFTMPDPDFPAQIQFLHASPDSGDVDIYDDDNLTSLVVDDLNYQQLTPEQPLPTLQPTYRYTPFDNTGTILTTQNLSLAAGLRYRALITGTGGTYTTATVVPDRAPFDTIAKLLLINESNNFQFVTLYVVDSGVVPDTTTPAIRAGIAQGIANPLVALEAGDYDVYLADSTATDLNLIAGPVPISVALGDIVDMAVFDNVADASIADLVELVETP